MLADLTASCLLALANGVKNEGPTECHWCGSPCQRFLTHDDLPYSPFIPHTRPAKSPGSSYICLGCWLWGRKRVTVNHFSGGGFTDGQAAIRHSWIITERAAWVIRKPDDYPALYDFLIQPSGSFALTLTTNGNSPRPDNFLQLVPANDLAKINNDTLIKFNFNNTTYDYCIYELREAILDGDATGKRPGIGVLFGLWQPPVPEGTSGHSNRGEALFRKRGRPPSREGEDTDGRKTKKEIFRSGKLEEMVEV